MLYRHALISICTPFEACARCSSFWYHDPHDMPRQRLLGMPLELMHQIVIEFERLPHRNAMLVIGGFA